MPLALFVIGGAVVVFFSFLIVLPRRVAPATATAAPADATPLPPPSRLPGIAVGLVLTLLAVAGVRGSQELSENVVPTAFWLLAWIAVPLSCGIAGDWTRPFNPFAALARITDREGLRQPLLGGPALLWPRWLGWWPAVLIFLLVASGELVFNSVATLPAVTAWTLVTYAAISASAGLLFGADPWLARGELFSVLFGTWGRLGWFRFGAPGRRGFGGGLEVPFERSVSRITLVLLLLVSVSFDGLQTTGAWKSMQLHLPSSIAPGSAGYLAYSLIIFAALVLLAWLVFGLFAEGVHRAGGLEASLLHVFAGLLPSLLPIAFGYLLAHNAEYLAINGQLLIPLAGDPAGLGWHLLPAPFDSSYVINRNLLPSSIIWYAQVALIVAVHIAAVILAHRYLSRAGRSQRLARRSEWPWIVAMVGYTMTSLWLLAQPLVERGGSLS